MKMSGLLWLRTSSFSSNTSTNISISNRGPQQHVQTSECLFATCGSPSKYSFFFWHNLLPLFSYAIVQLLARPVWSKSFLIKHLQVDFFNNSTSHQHRSTKRIGCYSHLNPLSLIFFSYNISDYSLTTHHWEQVGNQTEKSP